MWIVQQKFHASPSVSIAPCRGVALLRWRAAEILFN
jgi:hypothetical protein